MTQTIQVIYPGSVDTNRVATNLRRYLKTHDIEFEQCFSVPRSSIIITGPNIGEVVDGYDFERYAATNARVRIREIHGDDAESSAITQLASVAQAHGRLQDQYGALEAEVGELRDAGQGRVEFTPPTTVNGLVQFIVEDGADYQRRTERAIADIFYGASDSIASSPYNAGIGDFNKARETLTKRRRIEEGTDGGLEALSLLPKRALDAMEREWDGAEKAVQDYAAKIKDEGPIEFPIRVSIDMGQYVVVFPIRSAARNQLASDIRTSIGDKLADILDVDDLRVEGLTEPLYALRLWGDVGMDGIEASVRDILAPYEEMGAITPVFFETEIFGEIPDRTYREPSSYDDLAGFIPARLAEMGVERSKQWCIDKGYGDKFMYRLNSGTVKFNDADLLAKLAQDLGVDVSELEKRRPTD